MSGRFTPNFGSGRNGHDFALGSDRLVFWIGVIGVALTGLIAVWFGPESSTRLEQQVEQAARSALISGGYDWATADAHGQRVDLSGSAPNQETLAAATNSVISALGAGGVVAGGVTKVTTTDVDVLPLVSPYSWGAIREGRQITLEGVAPSREVLAEIETRARDIFGVANVTSRMSLAKGAPEGVDWPATAALALAALNRLDRGSAELMDAALTVTGSTGDDAIATAVREDLAAAGTGAQVNAYISGPAEWSASLANGALRFAGQINSPEGKQALSQIATDFFSAEFTDNSSVGTAGAWVGRMRVILPHFARFQSGQIDVTADTIRISGNAPTSALSFLREDMKPIDDGYTVMYNVREIVPEITEIAGVDLEVDDAEQLEASCQEGFTQIMNNNQILFETSLARIDRQSAATLDKLIAITRRCSGLQIEIEGHTDATGSAAANKELSAARAEAVRDYFITSQIEPERLTAVGYGEEDPVATNRTEEGRRQNRRIEFTVSNTESAQ